MQKYVAFLKKKRLFQYIFNADIQHMYRQIIVDPDYTRFQIILFRPSSSFIDLYSSIIEDTIENFELHPATFGINYEPYLSKPHETSWYEKKNPTH